jgi:Inner membrane protein YgaP-like, transmembrane domain
MKYNVGGGDRILRLAAGGGLLTMGLLTHGTLRKLGLILGGIGIGTAVSRFCPINQLAHRNTCRLTERISHAA